MARWMGWRIWRELHNFAYRLPLHVNYSMEFMKSQILGGGLKMSLEGNQKLGSDRNQKLSSDRKVSSPPSLGQGHLSSYQNPPPGLSTSGGQPWTLSLAGRDTHGCVGTFYYLIKLTSFVFSNSNICSRKIILKNFQKPIDILCLMRYNLNRNEVTVNGTQYNTEDYRI